VSLSHTSITPPSSACFTARLIAAWALVSAALKIRGVLPDWKLSYRIDEACAATGYGKTKIWSLIRAKKLVAKKDDGVTIILREDLQTYLKSLPAAR
jgi:hypothetical protein